MKAFLYSLILFGIILIVSAMWMLHTEMEEAEEYCKSLNKTYNFKGMHLCNEEVLYKYKSFNDYFWSFEMNLTMPTELNQSILLE